MTASRRSGRCWPWSGIRGKVDMWIVRARMDRDRRLAADPSLRPWYDGSRPFPFFKADVVLSYSAKSACTTVVMWYLAVEGHMDSASRLSVGPWRYPNARLLWSRRFVRRIPIDRDLSSWTLLRVMRNPLRRLVSSFRHAVRTGYADESLSARFGREIRAAEGLAVEEFLDLLEQEDLDRCNVHHRLQRNEIDDMGFGESIVLDVESTDLEEALLRFSRRFGLPEVRFDALPRYREFAAVHHAPSDDGSKVSELDDEALIRHRFTQAEARRHWPGGRLESLPAVQEAARRLYAPDWAWLGRHGRPRHDRTEDR